MLEIQLFGRLKLSFHGEPLTLRAPPRSGPLLAFLLLHHDAVLSRATVAEAIWPDDPPERVRANLRRHLHYLHKALPANREGPWFVHDARTVRWNPDVAVAVDVHCYEQLRCDRERLRDAVACYRGDLLEEWPDEWLFFERERLRSLYLGDLTELTQQLEERQAFAEALIYADQLLRYEPFHEETVRRKIRLRYRLGDRAGALAEYQRFCALLRAELGIEPMPETQRLFEAVRRETLLDGDGGARAERADKVRLTAADKRIEDLPLVGRRYELEQLILLLERTAHGSGGLALIGGEAGIGKSRLLREAAAAAAAAGFRVLTGSTGFPEAAPYQALTQALTAAAPLLANLPLEPVARAVLGSLVPLPAGGEAPVVPALEPERSRLRLFEVVAQALEGLATARPLLLLLEDLHLAGGATIALLEFLGSRLSGSRVLLIASYREEGLATLRQLRSLQRLLHGGAVLRHLSLGRLAPDDVAELLRALGEPPASLAERVRWLLARSEGNPFVLGELLRVQQESVDGAAPNLAAGSDGSEVGDGGSLTALLAARLARLSEPARKAAELAAVIGPAFSFELLCALAGWSEREVLDVLDELLDCRLVREPAAASGLDYAFSHHLLHEAIYHRVDEAARRRRHRRIAILLEQLYPQRRDELAAELARHFERGGERQRAAEYCLLAARQALLLHADKEALTALTRGLELTADARLQVTMLLQREEIAHRHGDRVQQQRDLDRAAELVTALGDDRLQAELLLRRLRLHRDGGAGEAAAEALAALGVTVRRLDDAGWSARWAEERGATALQFGRYAAAAKDFAEAIEGYRRAGDRVGQVRCRCHVVQLEVQRGNLAEAKAQLRGLRRRGFDAASASLDLPEADLPETNLPETNLPETYLEVLRAAFGAALLEQEFATALSLARERLALCEANGDVHAAADAHLHVATAAARTFDLERARAHFAAADRLYLAQGRTAGHAKVLVNLGGLETRLGHFDRATGAFEEAGQVFAELGDRAGRAVALSNLAWACCLAGDCLRALELAKEVRKLARQLGSRWLEAAALSNLGEAERGLGRLTVAARHLRAAAATDRALGRRAELAMTLCELVRVSLERGDPQAAREASAEALAILRASSPGQLRYPQYILWAAALAARAHDQPAAAEALLAEARAALDVQLESLDAADRASYLRLPFNRAILGAAADVPSGPAP